MPGCYSWTSPPTISTSRPRKCSRRRCRTSRAPSSSSRTTATSSMPSRPGSGLSTRVRSRPISATTPIWSGRASGRADWWWPASPSRRLAATAANRPGPPGGRSLPAPAPAALALGRASGPPGLPPAVSIAYALTIAAGLLAVDQLAEYMPGAWVDVLGAALLVLSLMTIVVCLRAGWRRRRDRLGRRALLWAGAAIGPAVLAVFAVLVLVQSAQIASDISGADVPLTRPLIKSLPRPPGTRLLDQKPGLADTESISEDFSAQNLNSIVPFYEAELSKNAWVEDKASATTSIVWFTKGAYLLSVAVDPPSSSYTLTVDRINANLLGTPSPTVSPTP